MKKTLAEIAEIVEGKVVGDERVVITGLNGIQEAKEGDLTFVSHSKYVPLIKKTKASAILVARDLEVSTDKPTIQTDNPSLGFTKILSSFIDPEMPKITGVHPTAVIAEDAVLGADVAVGPHVVIEQGVRIGNGTIIHAGSFVGFKSVIGNNCLIYPHVTIREKTQMGNNVIIHSSTVIGSDGFGYVQVDGRHEKIPQVGIVVIEDDVEIGANVAVDRARFDKTIIGKGTKIDNLVQIAHNVILGERCIIISQVGISGSTIVGNGAILAGQAGTAGHLTIGEGTVVAARGGVTKTIPPNSFVSGFPAKPHKEEMKLQVAFQKLPQYMKTIQALEKRVADLEEQLHHAKKTKNN